MTVGQGPVGAPAALFLSAAAEGRGDELGARGPGADPPLAAGGPGTGRLRLGVCSGSAGSAARRAWTAGVCPSLNLSGWRVTRGLSLCMTAIRGGHGRSSLCVCFSYRGRMQTRVGLTPGQQAGQQAVRSRRWFGRKVMLRWKEKEQEGKHCAPPLSFWDNQSAQSEPQPCCPGPGQGQGTTTLCPPRPCRLSSGPAFQGHVEGADASAPRNHPSGPRPISAPLPGLGCPLAQLPPWTRESNSAPMPTLTSWEERPAGEKEPGD